MSASVIESGSISEMIWDSKYRLKRPDGTPIDETVDDTFGRVARALATVEKPAVYRKTADSFFEIMSSFEFIPGGRILAGAGTQREVTLFNCYVMGRIEDSLAGIMKACTEAAMTLKQGGGVGMDFSTLRPRGAFVRGVESVSSGAVSFMGLWHEMCGTIMSAGARRGAMMGVMRIDHPDIEEFIAAKHTPGRLTNFNLSVAVTDDFMVALKADAEWALKFENTTYRTVRARDLWASIMASTYEHSEPGVIFIDRVNTTNPLRSSETIYASNPCGEQMLPPHGACLLGSINLARLIREPFTAAACLDKTRLRHIVPIAVRLLDNVIDVSGHPLVEQAVEAEAKRRIGLGVTGVADALIMLGIVYGSQGARSWIASVMSDIRDHAMSASVALGQIKGEYPAWSQAHGPSRRNSHLMSIAPTGTTSLFAGNVSSGIEPVFAFQGVRNVLQPDGSTKSFDVLNYAQRVCPSPRDGGAWVTADQVAPIDHVAMVAACQPFVDGAISKTINCPPDLPPDDLARVYVEAYALGAKGCTTFRPTAGRGAVLAHIKEGATPAVTEVGNVTMLRQPTSRPQALSGVTYKIKPGSAEHALYVTITDIVENGRPRPFEIFLVTKDATHQTWSTALSRMISAVFRRGGDVRFVSEELRQIFDPRGGHWDGGVYVPSMCAAIGNVIEQHMGSPLAAQAVMPDRMRHCPRCQTGALIKRDGCESCASCDYTKC